MPDHHAKLILPVEQHVGWFVVVVHVLHQCTMASLPGAVYVQDRDAPAGSQPRSARRPPHAVAAPLALCTAVASKKKDVPEQQRAFAINPVLEQVTRSFQKIMGTLYRDRRDFLGVVVVAELRGDKEGGFGSANERSRLRAMAAAAARPRGAQNNGKIN